MSDPHSVGEILDSLQQLAKRERSVSIGDIVEAFGNRSYGPFLIVPALIELSPIGGIPGLPTALAAIIALFAVQMLIGRKQMWLPGLVKRRSIKADRLEKASGRLRGLARFMDRWFHGRLPALTKGPMIKLAAAIVLLLAATVPPLELLPFASSAPMLAIAAFGLALLVRDGVLMIVALLLSLASIALGVGLWGAGSGGIGG